MDFEREKFQKIPEKSGTKLGRNEKKSGKKGKFRGKKYRKNRIFTGKTWNFRQEKSRLFPFFIDIFILVPRHYIDIWKCRIG